jgi:small subunit ribosomal protein S17
MTNRRRITGHVTSNKMEKTVVVEISRTYRHLLYKKTVHSRSRLMAHDELGCQIGDEVVLVESMPISRRKRWTVEKIVRHDVVAADTTLETINRSAETIIKSCR